MLINRSRMSWRECLVRPLPTGIGQRLEFLWLHFFRPAGIWLMPVPRVGTEGTFQSAVCVAYTVLTASLII